MERSAPVGRPKADDVWEHVTVFKVEKNGRVIERVKCKYCGFEFAKCADRIKSHIHQIKGQGIRLCPNRKKEKEDPLDSQECIQGYELPTADLVGKQVQMHVQQAWEWIMKNEVSAFGIWGMGGAGQTSLATYAYNDPLGLRKLEVISVNFCDIEEFNSYVKSLRDKDQMFRSYCLRLDPSRDRIIIEEDFDFLKKVILCGTDDLANTAAELPEDINELIIKDCNHWPSASCLCRAFCQTNSNLLKIQWLEIRECDKLEYLCCLSPSCLFCSSVRFVDKLVLAKLKDLKQIMAPFAPSLNSPFLCLKDLNIFGCNSMNILITPELLEQFKNLEEITIRDCQSVVEIFGENCRSDNTSITLPKLKSVKLDDLPELTFVFRGTMLCSSLKAFRAFNCEKLSPLHVEIAEGDRREIRRRAPGVYIWEYQEHEEKPNDFFEIALLHLEEGAEAQDVIGLLHQEEEMEVEDNRI